MVAFGDTMIDSLGRIRETPSLSAVNGLLCNALGVRREEASKLARLQDRIVLACRLDAVGGKFRDFQTAQLNGKDRGWTTAGRIQDRAGGSNTFDSPHIRERDYDSDVKIVLAIRLRQAEEAPTLDDLARAVQWPARPLFFGRKCCLPSAPIFGGFVEATDALQAFKHIPLRGQSSHHGAQSDPPSSRVIVTLAPDEACPDGFETVHSTEKRDWPAGVHAGEQRCFRGAVEVDFFERRAVE